MAADALPQSQRERLDTVVESGRALLSILNDILDIAKIEAGKLELESVAFDFGEVVNGACQVFRSAAEQKGVALSLDIAPALGAYRGDPTRLRQIIANLVSNALKFTSDGAVSLSARRAASGVTIEVSDTGIGMDQATLGRLFGEFAQAGASTARQFGGTGLGLSICCQLSELMGGEIAVASTPGVGSTFTVRLPMLYIGEARTQCAAQDAPADGEALSNLRILAAEDNKINQLVLKTLLAQAGIEVTLVDDGQAAVDAWTREAWDLILMDIQMPGLSGVDATRVIRARELATGRQRTPIIVLSANAMSHQLAEYSQAGADGYVAKPIETQLLFEALGAALAEAESETPSTDLGRQKA
jgi:CheY-like chemotaxis protein/two-component sensor histidine kinase